MYLTKKHLYISIVLIIITTIGIVLFVQPMQVNNATDKMVETLNEQYDEQFEVTWSDIEQQPSLHTYNATVKSTKSGYSYDVQVKDKKPTIDYERVNEEMSVNEHIEKVLPHTLAITGNERVVLIANTEVTQQQALVIGDIVQAEVIDVYQLSAENFELVVAYSNDFYERASFPLDQLEQYNPKQYTLPLVQ